MECLKEQINTKLSGHNYIVYFRKIIKKIDTDEDGSVSLRELAEWIKNVHDNYYVKDANRRFVVLDTDKDGFVTFNEYAKSMGLNGMYIHIRIYSICACMCACVCM